MRGRLVALALLWASTLWSAPEPPPPVVVAELEVYRQEFDWLIPWNRKPVESETGRAWQVRPGWWMTTADLVGNASLVQLKIPRHLEALQAQVRLLNDSANLALLQTEPPDNNTPSPVTWGEARPGTAEALVIGHQGPELQEVKLERLILGLRERTETWVPVYVGSLGQEPPPSGTPLFQGKALVGMLVHRGSGTPHLLPAQLLQRLINLSGEESASLLPQRGFDWRPLPHPSVGEYLGLPPGLQGVWIPQVWESGTGSEALQPQDVLTHLNGWGVDDEGQIQHPLWGRVPLDVMLILEFHSGDPLTFQGYRDGKPFMVSTRVSIRQAEQHIPRQTYNVPPRYVIRGGLLFQELSRDYLQIWGKRWAEHAPIRLRLFPLLDEARPGNPDQRIVLLSQVLPDAVNIGYEDLEHEIVAAVNGTPVHRLEDLVEAMQQPPGAFHQIEFMTGASRHMVVLPVSELPEAHRRLQSNYQIPELENL